MSTSSVLERFLILFSVDAVALEHGVDKAKKKVDGLGGALQASNHLSHKLGESLKETITSIGGAIVAFLSVEKIGEAIAHVTEYAEELGKVSKATGANIETLSAWSDAVQLQGGTAADFEGTVKHLSGAFADFAAKGKSRLLPFFKQLGVSMVDGKGKAREFMSVLPELADKFSHLSKQESFGIGTKMGLDRGTILLLQQGRSAVDEIIKKQRELGVVTEEDAAKSEKFKEQWIESEHVFRSVGLSIAEVVLPVITSLLKGLESVGEFSRKHASIVRGALIGIGVAIGAFVLPPLITMAATAFMAFLPFLLIGAAVAAVATAFGLLYDDVMNFISGNNSLIGQISEKYPIVGDIVMAIVDTMKLLGSVVSAVFGFLADVIMHPINTWHKFENAISDGITALRNKFPILDANIRNIGKAFEIVGNIVSAVWDAIILIIETAAGAVKSTIDAIATAYGKVKDFFGGEDTAHTVDVAHKTLATANASPLSAPSSSVSNNSNVASKNLSVKTGDINIQTQASDANGISKAIGDSLKSHMRQAASNFDDGRAM